MSKAVAVVASASAARRVRVVMFGMLTLLAALSLSAWAQPAPPPAMGERSPGMAPHGPGMDGMHGWGGMREGMGGMHHGMGGGMMFGGSPERMGRMIDHMLDGLNASDAQRSQIKQIAAAAGADLKGQAGAGRALRQRAMQAFSAPTVDAAAVEQVRQQMVQQHAHDAGDARRRPGPDARAARPPRRAHARPPGTHGRSHEAHGVDAPGDAAAPIRQAMPPRR